MMQPEAAVAILPDCVADCRVTDGVFERYTGTENASTLLERMFEDHPGRKLYSINLVVVVDESQALAMVVASLRVARDSDVILFDEVERAMTSSLQRAFRAVACRTQPVWRLYQKLGFAS